MKKSSKKHAPKVNYESVNQLTICDFETPFDQELEPSNRWVLLAITNSMG